uniref:t-SNARE coiled-coil homology domain-containing protein n=1 Tax=Phasianus colchicus TaxID=9054 RepID=A0A669Q3Z9_PHACC
MLPTSSHGDPMPWGCHPRRRRPRTGDGGRYHCGAYGIQPSYCQGCEWPVLCTVHPALCTSAPRPCAHPQRCSVQVCATHSAPLSRAPAHPYTLTAADPCALYCASLYSRTVVHLQHTPLHGAAPSSAPCNSARLSSAPCTARPAHPYPTPHLALCNSAPHTVHLRAFGLLRAVHHCIRALRILHHKAPNATSRTSAAERCTPARTFTLRPLVRSRRRGLSLGSRRRHVTRTGRGHFRAVAALPGGCDGSGPLALAVRRRLPAGPGGGRADPGAQPAPAQRGELGQEIIDDLTNLVENTDSKLRTQTRHVKMVDRKSTSCGMLVVIVLLLIAIAVVAVWPTK